MGKAASRSRIADDGACAQVGAAVGLGGRMLAPTLRRMIGRGAPSPLLRGGL